MNGSWGFMGGDGERLGTELVIYAFMTNPE